MKNNRLISFVLVAVMLVSIIPLTVSAGQFVDVPADSYYAEAVQWAYEKGVTTGVSPKYFAPDSTVTRGQVVTFLWRAFGSPSSLGGNNFNDVRPDAYYASAVAWAVTNGITTGTGALKFSPSSDCTYGHILTFIYRALGEPGDYNGPKWYSGAVEFAKENGLIDGAPAGELDVDAPCPRRDIVTYLYRAEKLFPTAANGDYKHVIIIGVDGGGAFFKDAETPNMDRIFADGAVSYEVITSDPTISAQSWGSLLTGVTPEVHGLNNSNVTEGPYDNNSPFPTSFRIVREAFPYADLGSFTNWSPINYGIVEDKLNISKACGDDSNVADLVCEFVETKDPTYVFVQFDNADHCGHTYGYGSPEHLESIKEIDVLINQIYEAYEKKGIIDDTLFMVTADHGGNGTGHGGLTDGEKYIICAAKGKTVHKGVNEIKDMGIRDFAAIVLYALGLSDKQPATWTGRVPGGLFEGVEGTERPVFNMSDYIKQRDFTHTETPALDSEASVLSAFEADDVLVYLPFDASSDAAAGEFQTELEGRLYYVEGYRGEGAMFNDGYVKVPDFTPNKKSFSVAFWMKTPSVKNDPVLFGNKDWEEKTEFGFEVALGAEGLKFNLAEGKYSFDRDLKYPLDYENNWVYVVIVVDRLSRTIRYSFDFQPMREISIHPTYTSLPYNAKTFTIGQDASGDYEFSLPAIIDEFVLVNGALTNDDLAALKYCYSK